jgi:hypothetical protein
VLVDSPTDHQDWGSDPPHPLHRPQFLARNPEPRLNLQQQEGSKQMRGTAKPQVNPIEHCMVYGVVHGFDDDGVEASRLGSEQDRCSAQRGADRSRRQPRPRPSKPSERSTRRFRLVQSERNPRRDAFPVARQVHQQAGKALLTEQPGATGHVGATAAQAMKENDARRFGTGIDEGSR